MCIARADDDPTCDGVDDDCDGEVDEDFAATATTCGEGPCEAAGSLSCRNGAEVDSCEPGTPPANIDDSTGMAGVDDDCDGEVDEDLFCDETPREYGPGAYRGLGISSDCGSVTVRLWGGAGAAGDDAPGDNPGGSGGAGGFAESRISVTSATVLDLFVGGGAASGCEQAGANLGSDDYSGGAGAEGGVSSGDNGRAGGDGSAGGGGAGGSASSGSAGDGGRGHHGGGGGGAGAGSAPNGPGGSGGGGGAASVLLLDGSLEIAAGGGGGGGGAAPLVYSSGFPGGPGGAGCSEAGADVVTGSGAGGGGGGLCRGMVMQPASGRLPHDAAALPNGAAEGGEKSCQAGGDGYAIVTFSK